MSLWPMLLPSSASRSEQRRSGEPCLCSPLWLCSLHVVMASVSRSRVLTSTLREQRLLKGLCPGDTPTVEKSLKTL